MKHILTALLATGLLLGGTTGLRAEDQTEKPKSGEKGEGKRRAERPKLTPEERAKRAAKAKERAEAKLKELKEKQAAGKLTDEEAKQLERLTKRLENAGKAKGKATTETK